MNAESVNTVERGISLWADAWRRLKKKRLAMACLWLVAAFTATAFWGEVTYRRYAVNDMSVPRWLAPAKKAAIWLLRAERVKGQVAPYARTDLDRQYLKPGWSRIEKKDGKTEHVFCLMGTDGLGRSVLLRLVQGARIAFQVGVVTSMIAIPIGVILGCLAGYFGGILDDFVVWLYSTFACMPPLLFALAIAMVVKKGMMGVYLGIALTTWVGLCRLIRGEVMKHKERPYVQAARALGISNASVMFRHIFPNVFHIVIISFSLRFPSAIGLEVIMSFLGIGAQGEPSWGLMISSARLRLWYGMWWEMGFTTLAILIVVLAFNLLGDALRDALDPRLRTTEA